jgi:uncharacterized caspase-like protein
MSLFNAPAKKHSHRLKLLAPGCVIAVVPILVMILVFGQESKAQDRFGELPPPVSTLRYLTVGVTEYVDPTIRQLSCCRRDAEDMAEAFRAQKGKLCPLVEGETLTDAQATRQNILNALDNLIATARNGDTAMIFLSGHGGGCGIRGEWGFNPHDFDDVRGHETALTANLLRRKLTELARGGVKVILILNCCHAGAFGIHDNNFVVLAGCLPYELAWVNSLWRNAVFTTALLEAWQGKADRNSDGVVTLDEVEVYVARRVQELLRDAGIPSEQSPSCGQPAGLREGLLLARI